MKTRSANKIQTKLVTLLYGATFSGKTTLGLQLADFKRNDGKPFRVAVVDAEGGGVDDAVDDLEDRGVDTRNIHIFYTQSLQELTTILDKIKNHETFYEYDEDGNETDDPILDADGEEFFPDAILIDGTTIFRLTSEQGLLELSKKRNTIKADKDVKIYREEIYLQIKLANLIGKNAETSSVDSVSDLIKGGSVLNDKSASNPTMDEELIVDESNKSAKNSIRINKKNANS